MFGLRKGMVMCSAAGCRGMKRAKRTGVECEKTKNDAKWPKITRNHQKRGEKKLSEPEMRAWHPRTSPRPFVYVSYCMYIQLCMYIHMTPHCSLLCWNNIGMAPKLHSIIHTCQVYTLLCKRCLLMLCPLPPAPMLWPSLVDFSFYQYNIRYFEVLWYTYVQHHQNTWLIYSSTSTQQHLRILFWLRLASYCGVINVEHRLLRLLYRL